MERRDPSTPEWQRFARYHLGRLLYQHGGDLNDAVSTLRAAYRQAPDDARVCYHLGWAIQTLVNEQSLVEAVDLFRRYLDLGAPLGDMSRVQGVVTPPTTR
jgi:tetratricopeptide (TPR) repeat protein